MRAFAGFDRIVTDPDVLDGKPCVRGTRLSVERVLEVLAEQPSQEDLQADYPQLTAEDVRQVLLFASRLAGEKIIPLDSSAA
ncbi:MAG: DUF433 domain-containing protein [Planctomycetota bacterium]|nr:MAG: DUF433 domain-containing protein [Planctomycetota bacterium]